MGITMVASGQSFGIRAVPRLETSLYAHFVSYEIVYSAYANRKP